jgi:hypothetical protein
MMEVTMPDAFLTRLGYPTEQDFSAEIARLQQAGDLNALREIRRALQERSRALAVYARRVESALRAMGAAEELWETFTIAQWTALTQLASSSNIPPLPPVTRKGLERKNLIDGYKVTPTGRSFLQWVTPWLHDYTEQSFRFRWQGGLFEGHVVPLTAPCTLRFDEYSVSIARQGGSTIRLRKENQPLVQLTRVLFEHVHASWKRAVSG